MFNFKYKGIAFAICLLVVLQPSITVSAKTFLNLEAIERVDDINYKIKELSASGVDKANMALISVDNGSFEIKEDSDRYSINYDNNSDCKNALLIFNKELSLDEVQDILRNNITYSISGCNKQKVTITISDNKVEIPEESAIGMKYIGGVNHYYMYVDMKEKVSWIEAYNLAKTYRLDGLKGYLATITSKEEDDVLKGTSLEEGWSGGTRLIFNEDYDSDKVSIKNIDGENYVWADGPEKGIAYYKGINNGINIYKSIGNGNEWGWKYGEPNNLCVEECMEVNYSETKEWNDLAYDSYRMKGFFVEFSKYGNNAGDESKRVTGTIQVKSLSSLKQENLSDIKVNYITKEIIGLENGTYKVDGIDVKVSSGKIDISDKLGKRVEIIKCGDGLNTRDSDPREIDIKDIGSESDVNYDVVQPSDTVTTGTLNIPNGEEYSLDEGATWITSDGSDLTDIPEGSEVLIRVKATADNPESEIKTIKIGKDIDKKGGTGVVNNIKRLLHSVPKTGDVSSLFGLSAVTSVSGLLLFLKRKK